MKKEIVFRKKITGTFNYVPDLQINSFIPFDIADKEMCKNRKLIFCVFVPLLRRSSVRN